MRPALVEYLNTAFNTTMFEWLIPYPAFIYAITMLVCLIVFARRAGQAGLDQYSALGAAVAAMVGGLIGARFVYILLHPDRYPDLWHAITQISGGTISWGAYIGGLLAFIGYLLYRKQRVSHYLDLLGSVIGLGPFLGRWSCFLHGCDFGAPASLPWAVSFPHGSIPFVSQVQNGLIHPLAESSLPVHPTQIYLSLNGLLLFILFTALWKKTKFKPGTLFLGYCLAYSFTRFFIEFSRGDPQQIAFSIFTIGQVVTFALFWICLGILILRSREHVKLPSINRTLLAPKD